MSFLGWRNNQYNYFPLLQRLFNFLHVNQNTELKHCCLELKFKLLVIKREICFRKSYKKYIMLLWTKKPSSSLNSGGLEKIKSLLIMLAGREKNLKLRTCRQRICTFFHQLMGDEQERDTHYPRQVLLVWLCVTLMPWIWHHVVCSICNQKRWVWE